MKKRKKPVKKGLYQAKTKAEFAEAEQRLLKRIGELNNDAARIFKFRLEKIN